MMITLIELPKLCNSQAAMTAAYKAGFPLQERGWMRYPAACWEKPAIVAMLDGRCVGALNYTVDDDDLTLTVNFAFADSDQPHVLTKILSRFRAKFRGSAYTHISFTCHAGNEQMAKAVRALRLEPFSQSYRMPVDRLQTIAKTA